MKNGLLVAAVVILVGGLVLLAQVNTGKTENKVVPQSIDKYYKDGPVYLINMFKLGELFQGIGVNIAQGDMENAKKSFTEFSKNYKDTAEMVPEWKTYYDTTAVDKIGSALDAGNVPGTFEAIGNVGASCVRCHTEMMPPVWEKYNWKDFSALTMDTPDGKLPFPEAKMKYLVVGFDGIGVNIANNNQAGAQKSFGLFKTMMGNLKNTCSSCHSSEPRYYVSADIQGMIDSMGENINSGNMSLAEKLRQGIGMESCYRCHVLHMPAQYAKMEQNRK